MPSTWDGEYSSYNDLIISCTDGRPVGYDRIRGMLTPREAAINDAKKYPPERFNLLKDSLDSKATVLEIGGDRGGNWVVLNADVDLDYHILEIVKLVWHGKQIFPEIHWHTEIPTIENGIDILYSRGGIQYLEDPDSYISECIKKNSPKKIIIEHTTFTTIETFWSKQQFVTYNTKIIIPCCFINFKQFDTDIKNHGYKRTYEFNDERYNHRDKVSFPEEHIDPYMKSIIYEQI